MEITSQTIQFIANLYFRILDFSNFCCDAHLSSASQKTNCKYEIFSCYLYKYLTRTDRSEDGKRIFLLCIVWTPWMFFLVFMMWLLKNIFLGNKKNSLFIVEMENDQLRNIQNIQSMAAGLWEMQNFVEFLDNIRGNGHKSTK